MSELARMAIAIIAQDHRVLVRRHVDDGPVDAWEFPIVRVEAEEASDQACRRGVLAELGCRLSTMWLLDTVTRDRLTPPLEADCYVCSLVPGEDPCANGREDVRWIGLDMLPEVAWQPDDDAVAHMVGLYWDAIFSSEHL